MSDILKELKKFAVDYTLLYIEDNAGLRINVEKLLSKFFSNVFTAENGREGLDMFKKHQPDIIITDINMPEMNGLDMAEKIKSIIPSSKIIIMSAHEEKEYLHQAIDAGIFRYLNKPAKTNILVKALYDTILVIQKEEDNLLLQVQLQDIFNYQNNIIIMLKDKKPTLVNHRFLDFFDVDNIDNFLEKKDAFDSLLLEHDEFLYTTQANTWYKQACKTPGKLYHTKIKNSAGEARHLILKARKIPNKDNYFVLSFDDITELNLMKLFDKSSANDDKINEDTESVLKLMKVVHDNSAEIKVHNFYRGLTITNPAVLTKVSDKETVLKTSNSQLKVVQLVKNTVLSSEIFPTPVLIKSIKKVDFEKQTISFSKMQFLSRSATDRKYIRLEPEKDTRISLFYQERKFTAECSILDISLVSIKVQVSALPPGVETSVPLNVSIILPTNAQPLIINTNTRVFRIDENPKSFDLILMYELHDKTLYMLKEYMANRQMILIREFRSLELKL
ncbi:MAG: response regulator receiver protein [Arcobacter sp.]|nr:MAG: response regulator receiver protein [Arcobacter sp.]